MQFLVLASCLFTATSAPTGSVLPLATELGVMSDAVQELLGEIKAIRLPKSHSDERFIFEQRELEDMAVEIKQLQGDAVQNTTVTADLAKMQGRIQHIREKLDNRPSVIKNAPELTRGTGALPTPVKRRPGAPDGGYAPFYDGHYGKHELDHYDNVVNHSELQKAASLVRLAPCGPQTKVCTAAFADAASNPQWECKPASNGAKIVITKEESNFGAKVCGPGHFHFSPMQCAGSHFEYKKQAIEVDATSTTTGCQKVDFPHAMACYTVEC
jgi:hypothetical protein